MAIDPKIIEQYQRIRWVDSSMDEISVDYDEVRIVLSHGDDETTCVTICNHIGLCWDSHWDENIIESADITDTSQWLDDTLDKVKTRYGEQPELGGGTRGMEGPWIQLSIRLLDGAEIRVLGQSLKV